MMAAGGATLAAAGVVAAVAPAQRITWIALALMLLGLGWNLAIIGATAMLTDAVPVERRAATQGVADVALALAGAAGGLGSGVIVASSGFVVLSTVGGVIGLALLPLLVLTARGATRRPAEIR